jgi:hypothetical protein
MFDRSLFDQARGAVSVDALAAAVTDLRRAGSELRGVCPLCGAGKAKSASAPFAVKPAAAERLQGHQMDLPHAVRREGAA